MQYFKLEETGQIYAYEDDVGPDQILQGLIPLAEAEIKAVYDQKERDSQIGHELAWVTSEMAAVADQLLMHEDGDDMAVATPEAWKDYRKALRRWVEGAEFFPDQEHRPVGPV